MTGRLIWIGHATVVIETAGLRIVTDPVLRDRVAHLLRRVPAYTPRRWPAGAPAPRGRKPPT